MSDQAEDRDETEDPRKIDEGSGGYPEETPQEADPGSEGRDSDDAGDSD
jgi:hypothetical protein